MTKTVLYVVRHGKTMFNALTRVQGWCDTPLTKEGQQGIHFAALGLREIPFEEAYSSDSGRAIETSRILLGEHFNGRQIPYTTDPRIREWCFGSLEGAYDAEMWGIIPRVLNINPDTPMNQMDFKEVADAVFQADTANWAETYEQLRHRVWTGFEDIAYKREKAGGGNVLVVSHGLTIAFLLSLIDNQQPMGAGIENGSVTKLSYENSKFSIEGINDISHIEAGKKISHELLQ
ncbi:histidine phosphatase family protein [Enterococcus sp. LJL120]